MFLQNLSLINFKNYEEQELTFCDKINCFVGNNGGGKTNLLDAIHYLSFCKSYFNPIDTLNIRHDADFFVVQGAMEKNGSVDQIFCAQKKNERKQFKLNKKEYDRFADHIGQYPLVMISPSDSSLIYEGSDMRRKYTDSVISQFDKVYLDNVINYNKALLQRNILLKQFSAAGKFDKTSLEIWTKQMVNLGVKIYENRKEFFENFIPIFKNLFQNFSGGKEEVSIRYISQLHDDGFEKQLNAALDRDRMLQYTSVGIHKDDLGFEIGGYPLKKFGSQGQQKSFLVALKLAQFDYTRATKGFKPILLFDDIFDKLDNDRVKSLMKLVSENSFGQVFITDAHPERISLVFKHIKTEIVIYEVADGKASLTLHRKK